MKEVDISSWEEFKEELNILFSNMECIRQNRKTYGSIFLFRGQANIEWRLSTTLERYTEQRLSLNQRCPVRFLHNHDFSFVF